MPSYVYFYDSNWSEIGSRSEFADPIAKATGIDPEFFKTGDISKYGVAEGMSWASKRRTARVEDEAYCLLGIFGINMPLLYGEGKRASQRLQEEIIRRSDDYSIFAHSDAFTNGLRKGWKPLAESASSFHVHRTMSISKVNIDASHPQEQPVGATITNKGIEITMPLLEIDDMLWDQMPQYKPYYKRGTHLVFLNCGHKHGHVVAISLTGVSPGLYERTGADTSRVASTFASKTHPRGFVFSPLLIEAKPQSICLRYGGHDAVSSWKQSHRRADAVALRFPTVLSAGFGEPVCNQRLNSHASQPGEVLLYPVDGRGRLETSYVSFQAPNGNAFVVQISGPWIEKRGAQLNIRLYTNLFAFQRDVFLALQSDRTTALPAATDWSTDRVVGIQFVDGGGVHIEVTSRRRQGGWLLTVSAN